MQDFGFRAKSAVVASLACTVFLLPMGMPRTAAAQDHPKMSNVVPDGGTGAIEGKIQSLDTNARQITIEPKSGDALTLYVGPSVRLDNIDQGDSVTAHYTRQVYWVVTPASAPAPQGATATVGEVAHTPGGIGPGATQLSGRVLKLDQGHSFDIVDATGGGVYTIVVTDPTKAALLSNLQVGNAITVSLTPLTITEMEKCGWFGCS